MKELRRQHAEHLTAGTQVGNSIELAHCSDGHETFSVIALPQTSRMESSAQLGKFGIPTLYRGTQFRSRLEARWAAFFDSIGWPWAYEPIDLKGYIPDFVLEFVKPLLVEVKPAMTLDELREATGKIERSGWAGEALIVGGALLEPDAVNPVLGLLGSPIGPRIGVDWDRGRGFRCLSCGDLSVLHESYGWQCRGCGAGGGNAHVGDADGLVEAWAAAGNRVQWRPSS